MRPLENWLEIIVAKRPIRRKKWTSDSFIRFRYDLGEFCWHDGPNAFKEFKSLSLDDWEWFEEPKPEVKADKPLISADIIGEAIKDRRKWRHTVWPENSWVVWDADSSSFVDQDGRRHPRVDIGSEVAWYVEPAPELPVKDRRLPDHATALDAMLHMYDGGKAQDQFGAIHVWHRGNYVAISRDNLWGEGVLAKWTLLPKGEK